MFCCLGPFCILVAFWWPVHGEGETRGNAVACKLQPHCQFSTKSCTPDLHLSATTNATVFYEMSKVFLPSTGKQSVCGMCTGEHACEHTCACREKVNACLRTCLRTSLTVSAQAICLPMCVLSALLVSMCVCVCVCEPSDGGRGQPERSSLMCLGGPGESRALEGVDVSALRDL